MVLLKTKPIVSINKKGTQQKTQLVRLLVLCYQIQWDLVL
jgi:hypothetical protein